MRITALLFPGVRGARSEQIGHMGFMVHLERGENYRGFVFFLRHLPSEFRTASRWRDYLFTHTVPGQVIEDHDMRDRVEQNSPDLIRASWQAEAMKIDTLLDQSRPGPSGRYSFNPDDHPGSHNCVTWAVDKLNSVLGPVLPRVRQGRIKLMQPLLAHLAENQE